MSIELDQVTANAWDVARSIANSPDMQRNDRSGLIEFIMDIGDFVADLQFTVALRDRLNEIIVVETGAE